MVLKEGAIIYLHCMDHAFILVPHGFQAPFWITIVNKTTAAHKTSRLKSDQILCAQHNNSKRHWKRNVRETPGVIAGEQERDRRLILLSVVSGTFLKRTALEPTWGKMWAHSWHSFVLPTGMNGMWTNGGAKALVLSSSSVTLVMFFTWILANVVFRRTCHGQRLLVQAIKFSFHLKSVFFMALYRRQNSRLAFDVQVYHLTFTMRHLSFIIQHCCLRCDIGVSQWHRSSDIQHSSFNIQHSSLLFNI